MDLYETKFGSDQVFICTFNDKYIHRLAVTLYFIATFNSIEHKELILHGCGVASGPYGFLFLGNGGAGKSTVASLSLHVGKLVLSDDLVCLDLKNKPVLICVPGINQTISSHADIRPNLVVLFNIVKADQDFLVPLRKTIIAQLLFNSFISNPWSSHFSKEINQMVFRLISPVVCNIVGFDLHFRKSPDFWKVIDKEFQL